MNRGFSAVAPAVAGLCCAMLLAVVPRAAPAADAVNRAELEKELAEARAELDRAAREVADITRQLHGGEPGDVAPFIQAGARGSMLGVNIGGGAQREAGVEVVGVSPGGPAERAGLKAGDVLVAVDGTVLKRAGDRSASQQLVEFMRGVEPGRVVRVEYLRDDRKRTATLTTAPTEPPIVRIIRERLAGLPGEGMSMSLPGLDGVFGPGRMFRSLELVPMTPKLGAYFGTDKGLLVVRAPAGEGLRLEDGDVLQTIDGRVPESPGHAFRILHSYQPGEKVKLGVLRQRKSIVLEGSIPASDPAQPVPDPRMRHVPATPPAAPAAPPPPAPVRPGEGAA